MSNLAAFPKPLEPEQTGERSDGILEAVRSLLRVMPASDRERILLELTEMVRPFSAPRAGDVLGVLLKFLPRRPEWTVTDLKAAVDAEGVVASPKEIYNALGYLTRRKHIRRIGYGRYMIDGMVVETSDDLGGENGRHEDAYRVEP